MEPPIPASRLALPTALIRLRDSVLNFPYDRWRWVWLPLVIFLATRLLLVVVAYLGNVLLPSITPLRYVDFDPAPPILGLLSKWDSEWYLYIASKGYFFDLARSSPVVFFPLYPVLMRLVHHFLGDYYLSGYLISNAAFLGGLIFLYRLAEEVYADPATAKRAVLYMCIFPSAVFYAAIYTESLFFFLLIGCIYFARKRRWWLSALFGMFLTATRLLGILTLVWVLWEWLVSTGWDGRKPFRLPSWQNVRRQAAGIPAMLLIPLGLLAYMAYLWQAFGDPLAFLTAEVTYKFNLIGPIGVFGNYLSLLANHPDSPPFVVYTFSLVWLGAFLAALPQVRRWFGFGALAVCLAFAVLHSSVILASLPRYLMPLFPFCLVLAHAARRPWLDQALRVTFAMLFAAFAIAFTNFGYFF
jgi:hypothetical protein